jgi:hypothetical protein
MIIGQDGSIKESGYYISADTERLFLYLASERRVF